jgi:outer membrane protein
LITIGHRVRTLLVGALFSIALTIGASPSCAEDISLLRALELARGNDPEYLGTKARLSVALARASQASAALLPQVSIKSGYNRSDREYETLGSIFPVPVSESKYNGYNATLNVTQSLWRHSNFIGLTQADASVDQGEQELLAAEQDLLLRLARAWFETLAAADEQLHAESRRTAASREWDQLQKAVSVDLAATPALEETRAKLEEAAAERIVAASQLEARKAALEEIVGPLPAFSLPTLAFDFRPLPSEERNLEEWMNLAESFSPTIRAARSALLVAEAEVRRQRSAHEPTLDLVASYGLNNQGEGNFPGQSGYDIRQGSVGVELNIPIYQGGLVRAKTREAIATRTQARQELLGAIRSVRTASKAAWYDWKSGSARSHAALIRVRSTSLGVQTAMAGVARDIKFDLDVLEAREQFMEAWKKLQQARYDTVLSWMRLKAIGGQLSDVDFNSLRTLWSPRGQDTELLAAMAR